jgi:ATP-dependent DNA ligase
VSRSLYKAGKRSGVWQKMRVNAGQEFVICGYTAGGSTFDALVFGYYEKGKLLYASRTRNGFTPLSRAELLKRMKPLVAKECPFANLPEARAGRWGARLTAAKTKEFVWLKPVLVGQFEFTEWTDDRHLRHSKFIACARTRTAAKSCGSEIKGRSRRSRGLRPG